MITSSHRFLSNNEAGQKDVAKVKKHSWLLRKGQVLVKDE